MKKIAVFYHVFSPADERKTMIYWWLDEQLSLMKQSGLADIADINMCITAPIYMEWGKHGQNILDFLKTKYPFVNVLDIRDTGQPSMYEGQTLEKLYNYCLNNDAYVLYIHSKGISNSNIQTYTWLKTLNYFCIKQWCKILKLFENSQVDIIGVGDKLSSNSQVSGNFWWAKSDYIKTLPNPIDSSRYQKDREKFPGAKFYRWTFEDWYQLENPKAYHIHNTGVNHYDQPYYISNIEESYIRYEQLEHKSDKNKTVSVIVPTMWKSSTFVNILDMLTKNSFVEEIIIINNNISNTPTNSVLSNKKIKIFDPGSNIFVNPAWNFGASIAKADYLLFLNDDIIIENSVIDLAMQHIDSKKIIALDVRHYNIDNNSTEPMKIVHFSEFPHAHNFGCFMLISKKDWYPVPAGLNIYYGDMWMWDRIKQQYNGNYIIKNAKVHAKDGLTANTLPNRQEIYLQETKIVALMWQHLLKQSFSIKNG